MTFTIKFCILPSSLSSRGQSLKETSLMPLTVWSAKRIFALLTLSALSLAGVAARAQEYRRVNLVSDIAGVALRTDPHLVNAWGIAFSETSPVWIYIKQP